jgi:uncharacterized CHY-type Zn-finger protein
LNNLAAILWTTKSNRQLLNMHRMSTVALIKLKTKGFSNKHMLEIKGKLVDDQTRCEHYHSPLDIIAIKFKCCNEYYACHQCHEETANHKPKVWKKEEWDTKAIFCGVCKNELTIREYFHSGNQCPYCRSAFNPNCSRHYHLYFEK